MNARAVILIFASMLMNARAATVLNFWHSYTPPQAGQKHYSFRLSNYKRGLFFGSCGISTKSQQWAFNIDLAGDGPTYGKDQVSLSDDNAKPAPVVSGSVAIEGKQTFATISLKVAQAGTTNDFVGNGRYKIEKLK
jgi:hypothetical protein